ncbi:pentapeptide repeat-containing protein [Streptomyces olivochromogenes]|uniref:pentapeptide repeat-containing protein n=1 Tax=Streptomyces olivochromogenes TaxID=1963 RepID=UPI001F2D71A1|nr:pentapeptide repeat-containing protein [Streptomyces olivochromogenes]
MGHDFDLTDATFDGGDLSGAVFSGGTVSFIGAQFSGGGDSAVDFVGARGMAPTHLVPPRGSPLPTGLSLPPAWYPAPV